MAIGPQRWILPSIAPPWTKIVSHGMRQRQDEAHGAEQGRCVLLLPSGIICNQPQGWSCLLQVGGIPRQQGAASLVDTRPFLDSHIRTLGLRKPLLFHCAHAREMGLFCRFALALPTAPGERPRSGPGFALAPAPSGFSPGNFRRRLGEKLSRGCSSPALPRNGPAPLIVVLFFLSCSAAFPGPPGTAFPRGAAALPRGPGALLPRPRIPPAAGRVRKALSEGRGFFCTPSPRRCRVGWRCPHVHSGRQPARSPEGTKSGPVALHSRHKAWPEGSLSLPSFLERPWVMPQCRASVAGTLLHPDSCLGPEGAGDGSFPWKNQKRTRTSFTAEQLYRLEMEFQRCQYVVGRERTELARQLNLSETQPGCPALPCPAPRDPLPVSCAPPAPTAQPPRCPRVSDRVDASRRWDGAEGLPSWGPLTACVPSCACLGKGSCWPSLVSPHPAPAAAGGPRTELGHEAKLLASRERISPGSAPAPPGLGVPGCAEPAAPGRGVSLLLPGRSEGRPSRSQPAAGGIQALKPTEGDGHLPLGLPGWRHSAWVFLGMRDPGIGLKFGPYFESLYVRGGESLLHPPMQKGRGLTGGLKLCERKHPKTGSGCWEPHSARNKGPAPSPREFPACSLVKDAERKAPGSPPETGSRQRVWGVVFCECGFV
ncbi:hypothetical protein DV515_00018611, partial [Chloebia gouldiae]